MSKPYVICHMLTSIDGKVTGDFLKGDEAAFATEIYYQLNRDYKAEAFACGRVTMEESFTGGHYPDLSKYPPKEFVLEQKMDYMCDDIVGFFAVAFDPHGRLGWQTNTIIDDDPGYGGAQIIEVITEQVDHRFLTYLERKNIPYIFAGKEEIDIDLALKKLGDYFGIRTLLLEGGSILNTAFEQADAIDELSLVVAPVMADKDDKPLFLCGDITRYVTLETKQYDGDVLFTLYKK